VGKKRKAAAGAALAVSSAKKPITYDARCNQLFRIEAHAAEFRRIVRGETFQSYLPVSEQREFAKQIIASIKENAPPKHLMTAIEPPISDMAITTASISSSLDRRAD
jgi:hypothetical protein